MTKPTLVELAWAVARDVNRTVGGGMASTELLRRTFTARGWLDAPEHALLVAISRLTPGTNILAYCAGLGWRAHGWRGSAVAVLAGSVPSALLIFALTASVAQLDRYAAVQAALAAGMLVAAALVLAGAWHLLRPYLSAAHRLRTAVVVLLAAALIAGDATPVRVLLAAGLAGAFLPRHEAA